MKSFPRNQNTAQRFTFTLFETERLVILYRDDDITYSTINAGSLHDAIRIHIEEEMIQIQNLDRRR